MSDTKEYKVLGNEGDVVSIKDVEQKPGDVVNLTDAEAETLLAEGKVELVAPADNGGENEAATGDQEQATA